MENVVKLLEERNSQLEKFYLLNASETQRMDRGDFNHVDEFYQARENILEMIGHIEILVDKAIQDSGTSTTASSVLKAQVNRCLSMRDKLVKEILQQDLDILGRIDKQKTEIIRELTAVQKGRKVVGAYHSGSADRRLDEEV